MARRQQRTMPHRRPPKRRATPTSPGQVRRETLATERALQPSGTTSIHSPWGRVDEEYAIIRADLKRLLVLTGLIFILLIALTVLLR